MGLNNTPKLMNSDIKSEDILDSHSDLDSATDIESPDTLNDSPPQKIRQSVNKKAKSTTVSVKGGDRDLESWKKKALEATKQDKEKVQKKLQNETSQKTKREKDAKDVADAKQKIMDKKNSNSTKKEGDDASAKKDVTGKDDSELLPDMPIIDEQPQAGNITASQLGGTNDIDNTTMYLSIGGGILFFITIFLLLLFCYKRHKR